MTLTFEGRRHNKCDQEGISLYYFRTMFGVCVNSSFSRKADFNAKMAKFDLSDLCVTLTFTGSQSDVIRLERPCHVVSQYTSCLISLSPLLSTFARNCTSTSALVFSNGGSSS